MPTSAPLPFQDLALLVRWAGGFAVAIVLPGWWVAGRRLGPLDALSRTSLSLLAGLVFTAVASLMLTALGLPLTWWGNVLLAALVGALPRGARTWRRSVSDLPALAGQIPSLGRGDTLMLLVLTAAVAWVLGRALGEYAVPPGLNDASNHAYLTLRILESRSLAPGEMFTGLHVPPPIPYLVGLHANAALAADCSGVAPYVSVWYLSATAAILYPVLFSILWRILGFAAPAVRLGCLLLAFNYHLPLSLYSWGGFGAIVGMAMLPWLVLVLAGLASRPGIRAAVVAGLTCVGMIHIHATELFVALLLTVVAFQPAAARSWNLRLRSRPSLVFLLIALGVGIVPLLGHAVAYQGLIRGMTPPPNPDIEAIRRYVLWRLSGGVPLLRYLAGAAVIGGLVLRRYRYAGLFALAALVVHVLLVAFQDPVTRTLTRPFYSQSERVLYLVTMLTPVLIGAGLTTMGRLLLPARWPRVRQAAYVALLAVIVWRVSIPGAAICRRSITVLHPKAPFSAADWRLGREIAEVVPPDDVIANLQADGSFWLRHAAGRRLLDPCGWPLDPPDGGQWRSVIPHLADETASPAREQLRRAGVSWLFVSSTHDGWRQPGLAPEELESDPRFERVLTNGESSLYRIHWPAAPGGDRPAPASPSTAPGGPAP